MRPLALDFLGTIAVIENAIADELREAQNDEGETVKPEARLRHCRAVAKSRLGSRARFKPS